MGRCVYELMGRCVYELMGRWVYGEEYVFVYELMCRWVYGDEFLLKKASSRIKQSHIYP